MRVLLTGMSGAGKSALVQELRRRGYVAHDADDDGFSEPRADGRWGWRADRVAALLAEEVLADLAEVEPLLRRSADLVLTTTAPPSQVADRLLGSIAGSRRGAS
jgi:hypothetical protein